MMKNNDGKIFSRNRSEEAFSSGYRKQRMEQVRRIDMHAHLFCIAEGEEFHKQDVESESRRKLKNAALEELEFRKQHGIFTCFSAGTPKEWQFMKQWREREELLTSFGIHPWYAERYSVENCKEYLEECDFIGEIGMDSVWCQVSLKKQQRVLEQQLQIAADLGKSVLLHTKGQEKEIGEIIKDFPGKICVHWYSGSERDLEIYLEKGCYFTLGPDFKEVCQMNKQLFIQAADDNKMEKRQGYLRILQEVSSDRLFLETDGLLAVAWARGLESVPMQTISQALEENEVFLAEKKQMAVEALKVQMRKNLMEFL